MYFVHRYVCMSVHDSLSLEKGREGHKTGRWQELAVGDGGEK